MENKKQIKQAITLAAKSLAQEQPVLKNQRKTVHIKGERTMDRWTALYKHSSNRSTLNQLYAAQSFLRGRDIETINSQHGDWHSEASINKTIEKYEQIIRTS
tara:strand:- start:847 stop:1152 length:306 start_codon:yes stop_codon:yes gene_type:complete